MCLQIRYRTPNYTQVHHIGEYYKGIVDILIGKKKLDPLLRVQGKGYWNMPVACKGDGCLVVFHPTVPRHPQIYASLDILIVEENANSHLAKDIMERFPKLVDVSGE